MDIEDLLLPAPQIKVAAWQLGNLITREIRPGGVALIFCSDERGAHRSAEQKDFTKLRHELYRLSKQDWAMPIADLGDFISGKNLEDTEYALQELLLYCIKKNNIPVLVGGSSALAYSLYKATSAVYENLNYVHVSPGLSLHEEDTETRDTNFLAKIFKAKENPLKKYAHLGFQKHYNDSALVSLMHEVDFDVVRLAEMFGSSEAVEPYFRCADMVTYSCDAVESFPDSFSTTPRVNGLNRREICAYMKEGGLSEQLKAVGIFNFNVASDNPLNHQLMAEMLWYLLEGIDIQKSHPKEREFETFWVVIDDREVAFKRDTFRNLWYFGSSDKIKECLPCSRLDFEQAKQGVLPERLLNFET